jgi:hypothetical protein
MAAISSPLSTPSWQNAVHLPAHSAQMDAYQQGRTAKTPSRLFIVGVPPVDRELVQAS